MKKLTCLLFIFSYSSVVFCHDTQFNLEDYTQPITHQLNTNNTQQNTEFTTDQQLETPAVYWQRAPRLHISNQDLDEKNRDCTVKINVSNTGNITHVEIIKSTGLTDLDHKILNAIKRAKFKPYTQNGIALPFYVIQPFSLHLQP